MMDLRQQTLAELDRREGIVRAAVNAVGDAPWMQRSYFPPPWIVETADDARHTVAENVFEEVAEHIALHDPADALRRYATARSVLARHQHDAMTPGPPVCGACSWWEPGTGVEPAAATPWPCPEILDLAASLGIQAGA